MGYDLLQGILDDIKVFFFFRKINETKMKTKKFLHNFLHIWRDCKIPRNNRYGHLWIIWLLFLLSDVVMLRETVTEIESQIDYILSESTIWYLFILLLFKSSVTFKSLIDFTSIKIHPCHISTSWLFLAVNKVTKCKYLIRFGLDSSWNIAYCSLHNNKQPVIAIS